MLSAGLRSAIAALVASLVVLVPAAHAVHAHEEVRALWVVPTPLTAPSGIGAEAPPGLDVVRDPRRRQSLSQVGRAFSQ